MKHTNIKEIEFSGSQSVCRGTSFELENMSNHQKSLRTTDIDRWNEQFLAIWSGSPKKNEISRFILMNPDFNENARLQYVMWI